MEGGCHCIYLYINFIDSSTISINIVAAICRSKLEGGCHCIYLYIDFIDSSTISINIVAAICRSVRGEERERVGMDPEIVGGVIGGAVSYLLLKLDAFATRELNLKDNINRALHNLGIELRSIEALLKDAASKKDPVHQFTDWIQKVRDQAYAIEDVLDLFGLDQATAWRRFKRRHSINHLIKNIEESLQKIQQTKERGTRT